MLIAPLLLALASQTPAKSATTLADLVPSNTIAFIQAPSLERAAKLVEKLSNAFSPASPQTIDVQRLLAMVELPGDASAVDASRPVGVCLVLDESDAAEPLPVYLIPVRDGDAFLKSLAKLGSPMQGATRGGYACIGMGAPPEAPSAPAAIAKGLPEGELALRLDLGRLVEQFSDSIEEGLGALESELGSISAAQAGGIDPAPVMGAYAGWLRDIVDSVETLDLAARLEGDDVELGFALANTEGSALAGFGSKEKTGARALAPLLDTDSCKCILMGMDVESMMKRLQPLFDAVPAAYPESVRPLLQQMMGHVAEYYGFLGSAQALSFDFTESGMRYRVYSRGGDPVKLIQAYHTFGVGIPGFSVADVPQREVAGVKIDAVRLKIDLGAFAQLAGGKDESKAADAEFRQMMDKVMGKDGMLIQVGQKDGTSLMIMGGDDDYLRASLARISAKPAQPAFLARAMQQVGDLNPCMIVHYDIGRMLAGMKDLVADIIPGGAAAMPSLAFATTFWGGVDGRVWRGAVELNLAEIAALARLQGRPEPVSRDPKIVIPAIMDALDEYAINNSGHYPESLEVLVTPDANGVAYLEGYDGEIPTDPWDNEYVYEPPSAKHPRPRVFSLGSDGAPGGTGDAADIDSDTLKSDDR